MSILLYGCTTWVLTKCMEKKLDVIYTRMVFTVLNNSWNKHLTKEQLYCHLPPVSKTIQVRQTRHAGHCWRSKEKLINNILIWTPTHGRASVDWLAKTYLDQFCVDTGCRLKDLPRVMDWFGYMAFNHCRLFNAKSIFIYMISSISNNSV